MGAIAPSEFGPGAVIVTLNLGCRCTILLERMSPTKEGGCRRQRVDLEPGDLYVMAGDARWRWRHGVSVPEEQAVARRAVVWRLQTPTLMTA
eukprot:m.222800 g.222800  ORF g.222800 m.222800 type:complete len:92 (-) comp32921_c0_seq1:583-858(-)